MTIQKNSVVSINYKLTDDAGALIDSSDGHGPLTYLHGQGNLISGLEASLEGKSAGDTLKVSIPPEEGYGVWDEGQVLQIPRQQFSGIDEITTGMQFSVHSNVGEQVVTVVKVDGDMVTVDANHPLAGKTLHFDVSIVGVREATGDELDHGHVHGPGGAH